MEAIVDLRTSGSFCEHFYLVVLEKTKNSRSVLHMWKITISSKCGEQSEGRALSLSSIYNGVCGEHSEGRTLSLSSIYSGICGEHSEGRVSSLSSIYSGICFCVYSDIWCFVVYGSVWFCRIYRYTNIS